MWPLDGESFVKQGLIWFLQTSFLLPEASPTNHVRALVNVVMAMHLLKRREPWMDQSHERLLAFKPCVVTSRKFKKNKTRRGLFVQLTEYSLISPPKKVSLISHFWRINRRKLISRTDWTLILSFGDGESIWACSFSMFHSLLETKYNGNIKHWSYSRTRITNSLCNWT